MLEPLGEEEEEEDDDDEEEEEEENQIQASPGFCRQSVSILENASHLTFKLFPGHQGR